MFILFRSELRYQAKANDREQRLALLLSSGTILLAVAYIWHSRPRPRRQVSDLMHNRHAQGSEVVGFFSPSDKVILIADGSSRLGRHVAELLFRAGAIVLVGVKNFDEGNSWKMKVEATYGTAKHSIQVFELNLPSLKSIRFFCRVVSDTLMESGMELDGIVNLHTSSMGNRKSDIRNTLQATIVSSALLTELLLPHLSQDARVIQQSSILHRLWFNQSIANNYERLQTLKPFMARVWTDACQLVQTHILYTRFMNWEGNRKAYAVDVGNAPWPTSPPSLDHRCATLLFCLLAPLKVIEQGSKSLLFTKCASMSCSSVAMSMEEAANLSTLFHRYWSRADGALPGNEES